MSFDRFRSRLPAVAFAVLALWQPLAALACERVSGRPSVGLVLSGGGARGAAHVGVLKVLEELSVPVDCVAGTSMGAIVGGLYASGLDAARIEQITLTLDWQDAFRDNPRRRDLSFRRKQDSYDFLADFNLGYRDGRLRLPKGLVQGQKMRLLLRSFTLPVRNLTRFDTLPTPYRAVATDAETGGIVVLDRGDLVAAMHASMAAPGIFAPVEIDGRILIDGGISNNLPIDVIRAMGADIIVAVDIAFPLLPRDQLDSAFALSNQALIILLRHESDRQLSTLTGRDVAVLPDLGTLGSGDFASVDIMIPKGEAAARAKTANLRTLAISPADYAAYQLARSGNRSTDAPVLARIDITDDAAHADEIVAARLRQAVGEPLDVDALHDDLARIYGLQIFESVDYRLRGDETATLEIATRKKSWGPNFLKIGVELLDDFEGSSSFNLGVRLTATQVNRLGAEWRSNAQFGDNPRFATEIYQPLGFDSRFFVAPSVEIQKFDGRQFDADGRVVAEFRVSDSRAAIDLGYRFNNRSELRLGLGYQDGRANPRIGDPGLGTFVFNGGRLQFAFRYDDLDSTRFPRAGGRGNLRVTANRSSFGADRDSERLEIDWLGVRSRDAWSYLGAVSAGSNLGSKGGIQELFDLGGLLNLSGYRTAQLRGQHSFSAVFAMYRRIGLGRNFGVPLYIGASVETGNVWQLSSNIGFDSLRYGGSGFVGIDTPIGPIYLGYGIAESGNTAAYFSVGQTLGR